MGNFRSALKAFPDRPQDDLPPPRAMISAAGAMVSAPGATISATGANDVAQIAIGLGFKFFFHKPLRFPDRKVSRIILIQQDIPGNCRCPAGSGCRSRDSPSTTAKRPS
jgi:hypothetical protein